MVYEGKEAPVSALYKAFGILETLGYGRATLADISRKVGMPKSTASRFLASLMDLGVVYKNDRDEFGLTAKLFGLGARALDAFELVSVASSFMRTLSAKIEETVYLAVCADKSVVYLHKVDSPRALRMHSRVGFEAPMYCTSLGKCLLAWMDPVQAEAVINRLEFDARLPNTITNAQSLREHLVLVREQGYACDNEEIEENVICFGAPIFNWHGQVIAAISVSMPIFRFDEANRETLLRELKSAAQGISSTFGFQGHKAENA